MANDGEIPAAADKGAGAGESAAEHSAMREIATRRAIIGATAALQLKRAIVVRDLKRLCSLCWSERRKAC